jgi:glycosyltransferase involved in cell wall biosynthesis
MRILIDATGAHSGGAFTYLVNLVPRLCALEPGWRFRVLVRGERLAAALPPAPALEVTRLPPMGLARRIAFGLVGAGLAAARWRADAVLSTGDVAPFFARCPTVASFRNPNVFTSLDQGWYPYQVWRLGLLRRLARLTARRCDRILFVSHDSAHWIGDSIGLPAAKRVVIHHGIDAARFAGPAGAPPHPRPYILSVSSIYRYKNFVRLIEAWTDLAGRRPEAPDLVIVGDDLDPDYAERMRAARLGAGALAERILFAGEVPYAEIPRWYAHARLCVFPSYLETFGHPLLEAMAAGVPQVAADIPVSREIAGDAARYADPRDTGQLARAIEQVLGDDALRADLVARGRERVRSFTWEASARRHLALFSELASGR